MNKICIIGRLTSDVELKMTTNGTAVSSFTVAVYRTKDVTDFIPCVAWHQTAEFISKYFRKGNLIGIDGALQSRKYSDKEGHKKTVIEVNVENASFCDSSKVETKEEAGEQAQDPGADTKIEEMSEEELPF